MIFAHQKMWTKTFLITIPGAGKKFLNIVFIGNGQSVWIRLKTGVGLGDSYKVLPVQEMQGWSMSQWLRLPRASGQLSPCRHNQSIFWWKILPAGNLLIWWPNPLKNKASSLVWDGLTWNAPLFFRAYVLPLYLCFLSGSWNLIQLFTKYSSPAFFFFFI